MRGGLPRPAGRPVPHDRAMPHDRPQPEYPPLPGHPPAPGWPGDCPLPDWQAGPGRLPPAAQRPRAARLPPVGDRPPVPDYPALPPYLSVRDHPPVPDWPAVPAGGPRALPRRLAGLVPRNPRATGTDGRRAAGLVPRNPRATGTDGRRAAGLVPRNRRPTGTDGRRAAALGYLTVPVFVVPLVIYLSERRGRRPARRHAAQALNVWFTGALYDLSAVIMGAMLALDSPRVALIVFAPLVAARWLVTLAYLVRAAHAASRGAAFTFPAWLCVRVAR